MTTRRAFLQQALATIAALPLVGRVVNRQRAYVYEYRFTSDGVNVYRDKRLVEHTDMTDFFIAITEQWNP